MEYYSASFKRKEILTPATMWVSPEDVTLSVISQTRRTNTVQSHSCEVPRGLRSIDTGGGDGGQGLRDRDECLTRTEFQLGQVRKF